MCRGINMGPESDLHRQLKRVVTRWLWDQGYAAIAEEVTVPGVGIVVAAAAGKWKRHNPRRVSFQREPAVDRHHVVFVECKPMRFDSTVDLSTVGRQVS